MWIKRKYESTLKALAAQFPAVVVTGARQVGKTSLVRRVFADFNYVSLDMPAAAEQADKSPGAFLSTHEAPLIIDEVQYAPSLFRHLKATIDANDPDPKQGRFILTGSQNFSLMQRISESLAGRCGVLQMMPLSAAELLDAAAGFKQKDFIIKGGWPELHSRSDLDPHFWYAAYLSTYLERDVRNILNVGSLRDFDRFLRATAIRTGQMLSYSELARDVGIAPNTAKKWISVLQASGQILLLEPYHRNLGKRLVKSPKIYLNDTGLAAFLMGFDSWEALARSPVAGALWETYVVTEVAKHFATGGRSAPLWYWRTAHGAEVDLLIEQGGRFIAVEAKLAENPGTSDVKGFQALENFYGQGSVISGWIACRTSQPYPLLPGITAVPAARIASHIAG
jgi:predicted AAA+ superfamily ATPase